MPATINASWMAALAESAAVASSAAAEAAAWAAGVARMWAVRERREALELTAMRAEDLNVNPPFHHWSAYVPTVPDVDALGRARRAARDHLWADLVSGLAALIKTDIHIKIHHYIHYIST